MEQRGELQSGLSDVGVYRRADIEDFVAWSRTTVLRLRETAETALARAAAAEQALAHRDRDMQVLVGRALLTVQEAADRATERAEQVLEAARAQAEAIVAEAEMRSHVGQPPTPSPLQWASGQ